MGRSVQCLIEFVGGLLAGMAVGYALGVLFAPYEGAQSRSLLADRAGTLAERPRQLADDVQTRVQRAVEQGRQAAAETRAELEESSGVRRMTDVGGAPDTSSAI